MKHFDFFNPFVDAIPEWPFRRLSQVAYRASASVRHLSIDELQRCADLIERAIDEERELYVEIETDRYVAGIVSRGGWELRYAPTDNFPVTDSSVRWLLNNWPADADEHPDIPSPDDYADTDALQDAIDYDHIFSVGGSPVPQPSICFAVLSLMKVEAALRFLGWSKGNRWLGASAKTNVAVAGDEALEALEALWCSQRMMGIEREEATKATTPAPPVDRRAEARRRGTAARNLRLAEAQAWTRDKWINESASYDSKADFARIYVNLIAAEFQRANGEPLRVTDRTISEVWLAGID
ncbi:MAG: hypothetical protein Q7K57_44770 [Burkholderiaceae bacterium]|nr:hypothetical protein [Burkholderiaceae bacterium]